MAPHSDPKAGGSAMRQVGTIRDEPAARRLADHLLTLEITTRLDPSPDGWVMWVHREERVDEARREIEAFLANPGDPRYADASTRAEAVRREAAKREGAHRHNTINLQGRLNVPSAVRCPVTYALIFLSVAVSILTNLGHQFRETNVFLLSPIEPTLAPGGSRIEYRSTGLEALKRGEVWRLVAPIFLHLNYLHITFNMIWLYQLGSLIELRKGRLMMAGLVLVAAVASNLGEYVWDLKVRGPGAPIAFGGMSGVVYALFGYAWMTSDYDPDADIRMPSNTIVWMVGWLVICMTGMVGPIANAAHLVGLGVGMLVGLGPHLARGGR